MGVTWLFLGGRLTSFYHRALGYKIGWQSKLFLDAESKVRIAGN